MAFKIQDKGMSDWQKGMALLEKEMPKQANQLLKKVGSKARTVVSRKARKLVRKHTGNYHKSIKRGKVWLENGQYLVRVYSTAPHKFLIEHGHRIVGKDGSEHGFQPGLHVFDKSAREIEEQYDQMVEAEFDKLLAKYSK